MWKTLFIACLLNSKSLKTEVTKVSNRNMEDINFDYLSNSLSKQIEKKKFQMSEND
jgi:hypothetical protein